MTDRVPDVHADAPDHELKRHSRWIKRCGLELSQLQNIVVAQADRLRTLVHEIDVQPADEYPASDRLGTPMQGSVQPSNQDWMRSTVDQLAAARQQLKESRLACGKFERELGVRTEWALKCEREALEKARWAEQADERAARTSQELTKSALEIARLERELIVRTEWARRLEKEALEKARWAEQADEQAARSVDQIKDYQRVIGQLERKLEIAGLAIQTDNDIQALARRLSKSLCPGDEVDSFFRFVTTIWRLTWPLRYLYRLIGRVLVRQLWNPLKWPGWIKRMSVIYAEHGWQAFLEVRPHDSERAGLSESSQVDPKLDHGDLGG